MSGRREIQSTIRRKGRKHLISRGVYFRSQIVDIAETVAGYVDTPQIQPSLPTGHIRYKIKIITRRRQHRMSNRRKRIIQNCTFLGSSPLCSGTLRNINLSISWCIGQGPAASKIHCFTIRRKRAGTLFKLTIHFRSKRFRLLPLFLFIPFRMKYISTLHPGNTVQVSTFRFITGRGEIQDIGIISRIHRRIIATAGNKNRHPFYNIPGRLLFPFLRQTTRGESDLCQRVFTFFPGRQGLCVSKVILIIRYSRCILTILTEHFRQIKMRESIRITITDSIHISAFSLQCIIDATVTIALFIGQYAPLRTIFRRSTGIGGFIMTGSIKVFTTSIALLCMAQTPSHSTGSEK